MSIYRYGPNSQVDEITLRKSPGGGVRMFLHAQDGIAAEQILAIKKALAQQSWQMVATLHNGKNTLEVRGARKIEKLEETLRSVGAVGNRAATEKDEKKNSSKDWFKNNLMSVYGGLSFLGDIGLGISAWLEGLLPGQPKDVWEKKASVVAYAAGSLSFLTFGRGDKSNYQLANMCKGLEAKLRSEGLEPNSCAVAGFTDNHNRGVFAKLYHKLNSNPAEVSNFLTGSAGGFILLDALKHNHSKPDPSNPNDRWNCLLKRVGEGALGVTTLASGWGTAAIHEQKRDPLAPKLKGFAALKAWIQDTPNRLAGYGYMISTFAHGILAWIDLAKVKHQHTGEDRKTAYWAHGLRLGFAVINIAGEAILSFASKGHGHGVQSDHSLEDSVYAVVADVVIRQPLEKREHLIQELSRRFIAAPEGLGGNPDEAESKLRLRVEKALTNPWAGIPIQRTAQVTAAEPGRSTAWQKRIADREPGQVEYSPA